MRPEIVEKLHRPLSNRSPSNQKKILFGAWVSLWFVMGKTVTYLEN